MGLSVLETRAVALGMYGCESTVQKGKNIFNADWLSESKKIRPCSGRRKAEERPSMMP